MNTNKTSVLKYSVLMEYVEKWTWQTLVQQMESNWSTGSFRKITKRAHLASKPPPNAVPCLCPVVITLRMKSLKHRSTDLWSLSQVIMTPMSQLRSCFTIQFLCHHCQEAAVLIPWLQHITYTTTKLQIIIAFMATTFLNTGTMSLLSFWPHCPV